MTTIRRLLMLGAAAVFVGGCGEQIGGVEITEICKVYASELREGFIIGDAAQRRTAARLGITADQAEVAWGDCTRQREKVELAQQAQKMEQARAKQEAARAKQEAEWAAQNTPQAKQETMKKICTAYASEVDPTSASSRVGAKFGVTPEQVDAAIDECVRQQRAKHVKS